MRSDKKAKGPRIPSGRAGAAAALVLVALLVCSLAFPVPAIAKSGHWHRYKKNSPTSSTTISYWQWVDDESGKAIRGGTQENGTWTTTGDMRPRDEDRPDGYDTISAATGVDSPGPQAEFADTTGLVVDPSTGQVPTSATPDPVIPSGDLDEEHTKLSEDPKFVLMRGETWGRWVAHMFYGVVHNITQGLMDMTKTVLGVMDPTALLSEGLESQSLSPVTRAVGVVAKNVARPIALAFLVVVFAISYLRLVDFRRGLRPGQEYLGQVLGTVVTFAIAASLIVNVDVILRGIYVLSAALVNGLNNVLAQNGIQSGLKVVADQISGSFMEGLENLTYSQAASMLFYVVGAFLIVFEAFKTAVTVIVTVAQRFVSLFLRMSVSPVPMAFFVSQDTRATGWAFLKKFGAVSFQALLLIVTIVVAGFVATVVINWGSQALSSLGATGPFEQIAASAIPTVAALTLVRTAVGKTEELASSLFGTR